MRQFVKEFFNDPLLTVYYKKGDETRLDIKSGSPAAILVAVLIAIAAYYLIGLLPQ